MKKKMKKSLSVILSISILLQGLSLNAFGESDERFEEVTNELITNDSRSDEAVLLEELPEYRTENSKRFLMSDNSIKAVVYSEPVHYEENEEYIDIDTTLKYENATDDSDVNGYVSGNGDFDVKFAKKLILIN